jgi:hypothetical protein
MTGLCHKCFSSGVEVVMFCGEPRCPSCIKMEKSK